MLGRARARVDPGVDSARRGAWQGQRHHGALARRAVHRQAPAVQLGDALDDRQAQALAAFAAGRRRVVAGLVEAVEQMRQVLAARCPAPLSRTRTQTSPPSAWASSVMRPPAGVNLSALSTQVGHGALEQLDVHRRHRHRRGRVVRAVQVPRPAARRVRQSAARCRRAPRRRPAASCCSWYDGSSRKARSPSERTRRGGVARVAQRHLQQLAVGGARRVAGPARVQRLQAGDGGGQRRAQVVRQVADALRGGSGRAGAAGPTARAAVASRPRKPARRRANSSSPRTGAASAGDQRLRPRSRRARRAATSSLSTRSGRVTVTMIQAASSVASAITAATDSQRRRRPGCCGTAPAARPAAAASGTPGRGSRPASSCGRMTARRQRARGDRPCRCSCAPGRRPSRRRARAAVVGRGHRLAAPAPSLTLKPGGSAHVAGAGQHGAVGVSR